MWVYLIYMAWWQNKDSVWHHSIKNWFIREQGVIVPNNNHINSIVDSGLFTDLVACPLDNSHKKDNTDDKESQTS